MQENYPIEYIQGSVQFFGRDFVVTPDVLIPRLETEGLVRRAREIIRTKGIETVIDIGTGSGIIGVSCADLVDSVVFLDISEEALDIAKKNFQTHFPEKSAIFAVSDLLSGYQYQSEPPLIPPSQGGSETIPPSHYPANILFVANLPYIRENDWENMSADTRHEPELALFGGKETGFELYEKLFEQLVKGYNTLDREEQDFSTSLVPRFYPLAVAKPRYGEARSQLHCYGEWVGRNDRIQPSNPPTHQPSIFLLIEFGFDQREKAEEVLKKYPWKYVFFPDYAGIERFAEIHLSI